MRDKPRKLIHNLASCWLVKVEEWRDFIWINIRIKTILKIT